jgi:methylthioribulose-1-phosphate dehydratase
MSQSFREIAYHLTEISKSFYARGWALGTSGNFSAVLSREPLRLAITPSAIDKSELTADQILEIDSEANSVGDHHGKPSDESLLHIQVVIGHRAGAVLHTHSIWSTICSDWYAAEGGLAIEGYEMLKGLEGVKTHQHREWVPIVENAQDMAALAPSVDKTLTQHPKAHGFLLRRHGLYTWGEDLAQAKRHVEIFEFLLETMGRLRLMESSRLWNR